MRRVGLADCLWAAHSRPLKRFCNDSKLPAIGRFVLRNRAPVVYHPPHACTSQYWLLIFFADSGLDWQVALDESLRCSAGLGSRSIHTCSPASGQCGWTNHLTVGLLVFLGVFPFIYRVLS